MISLREIQNLLINKAFNPYIDIKNCDKVLLHLIEEVGELVKCFNRFEHTEIPNELGDIVILLCFFSESIGIDLETATLNKISENIRKGKFKPDYEKWKELKGLFENGK